MKDKFYAYIQNLQDTITSKLEEVDGKAKFQEDIWTRPEGGGGRTRVIENGKVFEKGGVNISRVHGELPKSMQAYFGVEDADFFACGLSLVLHPKNPMVPTVHANWRYFEMYDKKGTLVDQWFGGGQDLTPYYLFEDDAVHFHSVCKKACDAITQNSIRNIKSGVMPIFGIHIVTKQEVWVGYFSIIAKQLMRCRCKIGITLSLKLAIAF